MAQIEDLLQLINLRLQDRPNAELQRHGDIIAQLKTIMGLLTEIRDLLHKPE